MERLRSPEVKYSLFLIRRSPLTLFGLVTVVATVILGIIGPVIAPYSPTQVTSNLFQPPSAQHLLGTDQLGRDIFSRILVGTNIEINLGVVTVVLATIIGTAIGVVAGFKRGKIDELFMRITDIFLGIPSFILALALAAVLQRSLFSVELAIVASIWPTYARLVRSQVLALRESAFVEAARSAGASDLEIIRWHLLPNSIIPLIVLGTLQLGGAILIASALGFLGIGVQEPTPEWGLMVATGRLYVFRGWWIPTFPGLAISLVVLGCNLLGDGLGEILDPRQRRAL